MSCDIQNDSGQDMSALTNMVKRFYPYAQEYLGFDKPAQIVYASDASNADDPLGKTAHYQPDNYTVTLYVDGRHPKDLLRSLAHELVHHTQNCRGDLSPEKMGETGDGYAQTDGHLRKMEQEAYASMVMRDWEDQYKSKRRNNLHETNYINKEYITMSEHEKLVKSIVAEIMKNATITTGGAVNEEEEEEDVQEEGQGDRKDSRDNNQQGHRQGNASDGSPGQNLEEGEDEDEETVDEAYAGGKAPPHRDPKTSQKCYDKAGAQVKCGSKEAVKESQDEDEETVDEAAKGSRLGGDRAKQQCEKQGMKMVAGKCVELDESSSPDVSKHRSAGTIEEAEDDEEDTDDLQETFQRRQEKLYERLIKRWAK
jgi:hypothetical protein|tara:strand:- start:6117 stop:7220 length:1104 start_codon:yes stop_codon:yes gene_type:complete